MNYLKITFCLLFLISKAFACLDTNAVRHVNSDNSIGGFVSSTSKVHPSAYISINAKICEKAWVDENAKIFDYAVIKGDAWVREFSIVKENAVISEKAVIWGVRNSPAIAGGNAKIYGNAKILTGTIIGGNAEVFENVIIKDSIISGDAKVCGSYKLTSQTVEDSYYCSLTEIDSRAILSVLNYKSNEFNHINNTIEISSSVDLSIDRILFNIMVNSTEIPAENIKIFRNRISIEVQDYVLDGFNTVTIQGKDVYGKNLLLNFEFVAGSTQRVLSINRNTKVSTEVVALVDGSQFKVSSSNFGNQVTLKNLPSEDLDYTLIIKVFDKDGFYYQTFESVSDVPDDIILDQLPDYINNDLDFANGLSSWTISRPENASISIDGEAVIQFDSAEAINFSKTFRVPADKHALEINLKPTTETTMFDNSYRFQVISINRSTGAMDIKEFSLADLFSYGQTNENEMTLSFPKESDKEEEITVIVRLLPSPVEMKEARELKLLGLGMRWVNVIFSPKNFSATNVQPNEAEPRVTVPASIPLEASKCNMTAFNLGNRPLIFNPQMSDMAFFSVGSTNSMPQYLENRIYGDLKITNAQRKHVQNIRIVISQGTRVVSDTLSPCALAAFNGMPLDSTVKFVAEKNLVKPLFAIPSWIFNNFEATPGQSVIMRVDVQVETAKGLEWVKGDPSLPIKVLASPNAGSGYTYGVVDYYDQGEYNLTRTGGDKWILPTYAEKLMTIMNHFYIGEFQFAKWRFDDLSKMHGGLFPPHGESTHIDGRDADVKFEPYTHDNKEIIFDFKKLGDDQDRWKSVLYEIENFLQKIELQYDYIRDIYIERENPDAKKFLNVRFANRCFNDQRFIQFERGNGQGSLMRDVPPHFNHLHLRFNESDANGNAVAISKGPIPTNDIDDLWFKLGPDGNKLEVFPADDTDFVNKYIAWRFQDITGFNDLNMNLETGGWPRVTPWSSTSLFDKGFKAPKRYIYVTIANRKGGGCVQREVEVDPSKIKKDSIWTYRKKGISFEVVYKDRK